MFKFVISLVFVLSALPVLAISPVDTESNKGLDQESLDVSITYYAQKEKTEDKGELPEGTYVNTSRV
jgi:hypothetical protein